MRGTIKKVVADRGFGFITGDDKKDYFFHLSACQNFKFEEIKSGDNVTFNATMGPRGARAESIHLEGRPV